MDKEKLLEKWLRDDLNPTESKQFEQLEDFHLNREIIEGAKQFKASQFSTPPTYDQFKANLQKVEKPTRIIQLNTFVRVAAVVVICLGLYFTFFNNQMTTVQTLASQQNTLKLPDASSVILNAQSTISFNKNKWNGKREVKLDGEAFFKVAKGSKFDVITDAGVVSVLGTQFTVNNRKDYFEVKCFEGIVSVSINDVTEKLTIGKTLRVIRNKLSFGALENEAPEWISNKSNFKSVPFFEVLNELERQYNISISTENVDTERIFTGGFLHTDLEQALRSITTPLEINYRTENENKIIIYSNKE